MKEWLEVIVPVVRECGKQARHKLLIGPSDGKRKKNGEWVTKTDKYTEQKIIEGIKKYFPQHSFLGEEGGMVGNTKECWVIDPIDGTTNFVHGYQQSAISVAFCRNGQPELAIIYDYVRDDIYTAASGRGAHVNNERIRVSTTSQFASSLFAASGQINRYWQLVADLAKQTDGVRRTGSTVIDLAHLASGKIDAVVSGPVNYWDVAAGALLVQESGGLISDINNKTKFAFNAPTAVFVMATPKLFSRYFTLTKHFTQQTLSQKQE